MKIKHLLTASCFCALASSSTPVLAQDDPVAPPPPPRHENRGERLTPEERERLRAAHDQAMQDESVKAAHDKMRAASEEFRKVLRPALLAVDPSLAPILDKMEKAEKDRMDKHPGEPGAGRPPGPPPGDGPGHGPMGILTKEERDKLEAARDKVKDNADVKEAHDKQEAAAREFREAMKAAMLKADPSIEPLLEKAMEMRRQGGGPGGPEGPGGGPRGRKHEGAGNPPPPPPPE